MAKKIACNYLSNQLLKTIQIVCFFSLPLFSYGADTSSVMRDFSFRDTMADNVYQQITNGTYRTVELLNLIALNE